MTFLPIVDRELRVGARRHSTYSGRLALALAAITIGVLLYFAEAHAVPQTLSKQMFAGLGGLGLLFCLASGRRSTADCLSQEKREGTLGLLFLTDLKGHDVVLGKIVATSVAAFYGLLAMVPVLGIPLLMGGVTDGEFWRTVLVLVNTFLYSLAIGAFASVLARDSRQAMGANLLLLLMLSVAPLVAAGLFAELDPNHRILHPLCFTCPGYSYYFCFDAPYKLGAEYFWLSVGVTHLLTWVLIAASSWIVPHSWQDQQSGKGEPRRKEWWRILVYGTSAQRRALRTRLLAVNPFCWLASRARLKVAGVWVLLAFVAGWWFFMRLVVGMNWTDEAFSLPTALMLNSVLKIWIGIEAGQCLAEEQKMGTLELLLSTPLSEREILRGQLLALKRQFLKPLATVIAIEVLFMFLLRRYSYVSEEQSGRQIAFGLAGLALLVLDLPALIGVALTFALTAKTPNQASVNTILRVLFLPWVVFAVIASISTLWTAAGSALGWQFYLYLWFWLSVVTDLAFGLPAWHKVRTRFRELALLRVTASHGRPQSSRTTPAPAPRVIEAIRFPG